MLKKMENLPNSVLGISAEGTVTGQDYETFLVPLLDEARRKGERVRFLYHFGPEFSNLSVGAAMNDFKVGLKYLRLFERCAIVTDSDWIRRASSFAAAFMPVPVQVFGNDQLQKAVEWLTTPSTDSNLDFEIRNDDVLVIRPKGPLKNEDFDKLANVVDPWLESHHRLSGVVVSMKKFPGWENFGTFIHHMEFVKAHHRQVRRVAAAVDGALPEIMSKIAGHFVEAEIKQFPFAQTDEAIEWVKG